MNVFYKNDYKGFWKHWNKVKNNALECTDSQKVSFFLSNAIVTLRNAEVTEANAEVIEKMALKNPECLLSGLSSQLDKNQRKLINHFIIQTLYSDSSLIEKSLNKIWVKQKYLKTKEIYYKLKNAS